MTEVLLRLQRLPTVPAAVTTFFESLKDAGRAVALIGASSVTPSALELVDRAVVALRTGRFGTPGTIRSQLSGPRTARCR